MVIYKHRTSNLRCSIKKGRVNINNNLKSYRKKAHLSQSKVAKIVGINETHYQKIEYGLLNPSVEIALLIAQALHTKVEEIFPLPQRQLTGEGEPDGNQAQNK